MLRGASILEVLLIALAAMAALQRVRPVVVGARTHTGWYQAVVGSGERRSPERPLYEVQQPQPCHVADRPASRAASQPLELAVPTLNRHPRPKIGCPEAAGRIRAVTTALVL